jgi:hypothetical protein
MERYSDEVFGSYIDQILADSGSFPTLQADSSCGRQNRGDANEVVGGGREDEEPFYQGARSVNSLAAISEWPAERARSRAPAPWRSKGPG